MRIAEIFHSIQGEGKLAGVPSVFVRVSGCNLRCVWCDTPYASWEPEGPDMTVAEIVGRVRGFDCRHVVLTGGEPMMFGELLTLMADLHAHGIHITVETAGTLWLEGLETPMDLASVSPKLGNSTPHERAGGRFALAHERNRLNLPVLRRFASSPLVRDIQWKFVVARPEDVEEIQRLLAEIGGVAPEQVLLMPEGVSVKSLTERSGWLGDLCKAHGYRFCPRLHILLYGNRRGT